MSDDMFKLPEISDFRRDCDVKWYEYKDEVEAWERKQVTGSPKDYFNKYKWFLKEKYKAENK